MLDDVVRVIAMHGIDKVYPILILVTLRPFGLMFAFIAFSWAMRGAQMLKLSIAIALALPTLVANIDAVEAMIVAPDVLRLLPISLKEFAVGYALGFLASLPFFALQYAGAITDTFRGENDTGIRDPMGGSLHTFSLIYLIVGFFAFFSFGGLEQLVRNLYATYGIWPIGYVFPTLTATAGMIAVDLLVQTLTMAVQTALPLLGMLLVIEFSVSIAARLGKRFNFYDMSFPIKNLAVVLTLPLTIWLIWALSDDRIDDSGNAPHVLEAFFE
jgi:type III secretion protein T